MWPDFLLHNTILHSSFSLAYVSENNYKSVALSFLIAIIICFTGTIQILL